DGAIQTHRFNLDADQLLLLQLLEHSIQNTSLRPAIHASVDRMPIAQTLRYRSPLTPVLRHVQNRVDYREVLVRHVAALARQKMSDASKLFFGDLHRKSISLSVNTP